jgi:putative FmdB family regulatory protein
MPIYEYKCLSCGHKFEVLQKVSDEPIKVCPECGGEVKKLIGTGAGLIFKGSGFYITDYKKNSTSSKTTAKQSENVKTDTKSSSSESKTETSSKTKAKTA